MWSVLKGIAWVAGTLLVVWIGCFAWGRLRPASDAQAQALFLLQQNYQSSQGHNAWATFWLLDYDLPADQIDSAYAQERQHLVEWASRIDPHVESTWHYEALAAGKYPKWPKISEADLDRLCRSADTDCLSKLRQQASPPHDLLAQEAPRLARFRSITGADFLWDDTPPTPYTPLPALMPSEDLQRTSAALDFIEGRREQGLTEVCRNAQTIRQLHAHTNSLIGAMVMVSWMDAAERLFAGMLAELPADQAVPAICSQAFAPVTLADIDLCAPMQREFAWSFASMATIDPARAKRPERYLLYLLVDVEGMRRMIAPRYAWACQVDVREAMLADRKLTNAQAPPARYDIFDGASNAAGVILARIASPDYAQYLNRNEDFAAGLQLAALLLQARHAVASPTALPRYVEQNFPVAGKSGTRIFRVDPDGRHVRMSYYAPRQGRDELVLSIAP